MEHYDLRVIADCLVFSYEVEPPKKPQTQPKRPILPKKASSRRERLRERHAAQQKQLLLRFFLIMLMPFAFVLDAMMQGVRGSMRLVKSAFRERARFLPTIGTVSCLMLATALFAVL